ncbi:hypothetical protein [Streptomyces sp. NPDC058295]|uniref:hypothetical protein n=1 Tax=Streptomyces sp. NPDC058295 TaxID=3346431 RepID=UPI0036E5966A
MWRLRRYFLTVDCQPRADRLEWALDLCERVEAHDLELVTLPSADLHRIEALL